MTMHSGYNVLIMTRPPYWTHEDAGTGYLIFHSAMEQKLPLTYIALNAWKHNKFWINWMPQASAHTSVLMHTLSFPRHPTSLAGCTAV